MTHPLREAVDALTGSPEGRKVGVGCPAPASMVDMRRDNGSVEWMIAKSPRLALARAMGIDMVPYVFMVPIAFPGSGAQTLTDQGPNKPISRDILFTAIDIDIQNPNGFTADEFKPQSDFFFAITSGIQVAVNIYGAQRRRMSYAPLRAMSKYVSSEEPWVLLEEQYITLDVTTTTNLPFTGITVNVSFIGRTPVLDNTFRMSETEAFNCLDRMGYSVDGARKIRCG